MVETLEHLRGQCKTVQQLRTLQESSLFGCEPKPLPYLLGQMNLLLHGLDSPQIDPGTSNKQLNFVQHMFSLLKIDGRAAVVLPDNVLFEGGAGEKVRKNLLQKCNVHTLLRLPTGIWYANGVKANVLFFDKKEGRPEPWTDKLWVYDLRTNKHFTQKQSPIMRKDFDEFVACYKPGAMHKRKPTWSEENPDGRWRCYDSGELLKRDKLSLDLFWIKDKSLTDTDALPAPDIIATEIADELEAALGLFSKIAAKLPKSVTK